MAFKGIRRIRGEFSQYTKCPKRYQKMAQNAGFAQISIHLPPFARYRAMSSRNSVRMRFTGGLPRLRSFFPCYMLCKFPCLHREASGPDLATETRAAHGLFQHPQVDVGSWYQ